MSIALKIGSVTFQFDDTFTYTSQISDLLVALAGSSQGTQLFGTTKTIKVGLASDHQAESEGHSGWKPNTGYIYLSPDDWTSYQYINELGGKSSVSMNRTFTHELIHATTTPETLDVVYNGIDIGTYQDNGDYEGFKNAMTALLANPNSDFTGATEARTNSLMWELFHEHERTHYYSLFHPGEGTSATASELRSLTNYTLGQEIDSTVQSASQEAWNLVIDRRGSMIGTGNTQHDSRDLILGYDGIQTIYAGGGNDFVYAGDGNDLAAGGAGVDYIQGNEGDDILTGGDLPSGFTSTTNLSKSYFQTYHSEFNDGSKDVISGGLGHDTILIESDAQTAGFFNGVVPPSDLQSVLGLLDYVDGSDTDYVAHVQFYSGSSPTYFAFTQDTVKTAMAGGNPVIGQSEWFDQGAWQPSADIVAFRVDSVDGVGPVMLLGSWGASWGQEFYAGVTLNRNLIDSAGQWTIVGTDPQSSPQVQGVGLAAAVSGNDTLYGGNTQDGIYAYGGDDLIKLGDYAGGNDIVDGGSGTDTADYSALSSTFNLTINISAATGTVTGLGTTNDDTLKGIENIITSGGADNIVGSSTSNRIDAHGSNDVISGGAGDDIIYGGAGADNLDGGVGNDILSGDTGSDTLVGGVDNDTYYVDVATDVITESSGTGTGVDLVYSTSATYTLSANVENIVLLVGGGDASGNALNNILTGNGGNNRLDGLAGADAMTGGLGNDVYYVDNAGDQTIELAGGGNDRVVSTMSWTLATGNQIEELDLDGGAVNTNGIGNEVNNLIIGSNGDNTLSGLDGNDTLNGGLGRDILKGGNGNDILDGGNNQDMLTGGAGSDTFKFTISSGNDEITDFTAGTGGDMIDLSSVAEITGFNNLKNSHVVDNGNSLTIFWNDASGFTSNFFTLDGVSDVSQLTAANFLFA